MAHSITRTAVTTIPTAGSTHDHGSMPGMDMGSDTANATSGTGFHPGRGLVVGAGTIGGALLGFGAAWKATDLLAHGTMATHLRVGFGMSAAAAGALALGLLAGVLGPKPADPPARPTPTDPHPSPSPVDSGPLDMSPTIVPKTVTGVSDPAKAGTAGPEIALTTIASGLTQPVHVTSAPGDTQHMYVVQQAGSILAVDAHGTKTPFLDITNIVGSGGERGLLSVAFHPDYAKNGKLYVDFTDKDGNTNITEFTSSGGHVDPASARTLMKIDQPYANHNGGQLQFGPDGDLYIGMGDGGSGGDPDNRAQNPDDLLGKMLRIDVDHPSGGKPYGIPADNPFAGGGGKPEIFATGVRNPWRFSFDSAKGDLWIGDVGQGSKEEIDVLPKGTGAGANLGWNILEGSEKYKADGSLTGTGPRVDPVLQYGHDQGAAITGGYVYRGSDIPSLKGYYVYADYAANKIRAVKIEHGQVADRRELNVGLPAISSFGQDAKGELYVTSLTGTMSKISAPAGSAPTTGPGGVGDGDGTSHVEQLKTVSGQFKFDRTEIHVPAGSVTLKLTNTEGTPHNIGVHLPGGRSPMSTFLMQGQTGSVTFDAEPGQRYTFFCAPHEGMGMTGTVIVDG